ncbi:MAG: metallophosphoesterase [Rubripirellula sp.]|nr:metallophosphoesterase [Rubripirellula sp.]
MANCNDIHENDLAGVGSGVRRRAFMRNGALVLTAASLSQSEIFAEDPAEPLRIGLITDLHHADKPAAGSRHYRETLGKLEEAGQQFEQQSVDFVVELGDLIDAADSVAVEMKYLQTVNREFSKVCRDRHYVLGNHCVDTLTKKEFLGEVGQEKSYYSFDRGGLHFVILDSCFRGDGQPYGRKNFQWTDANLSVEELEWLEADLGANEKPVIVFAHQRLDVKNNHGVKNQAKVRSILEASQNVIAVFQGHSHKNDIQQIAGIHYCTLVAMVEGSGAENSGYSVMEVDPGGTIHLTGFRKQKNRLWQPSA